MHLGKKRYFLPLGTTPKTGVGFSFRSRFYSEKNHWYGILFYSIVCDILSKTQCREISPKKILIVGHPVHLRFMNQKKIGFMNENIRFMNQKK